MKSSLPQGNPSAKSDLNDNHYAPMENAARPSLMRLPPGRLSDISEKLRYDSRGDDDGGRKDIEDVAEASGRRISGAESSPRTEKAKRQASNPDDEQLASLRDAMNAKLLLQQRHRRSHGSPKLDTGSNTVSPFQKDPNAPVSPSSNTQPDPDLSGWRTKSTDSTGSTKTIRANKPTPPPEPVPLRTPSYPFPYVPGSPKAWPPIFHQPFTALSPTVGVASTVDDGTTRKPSLTSMRSGESTPAADNNFFVPPGTSYRGLEDPGFPTPNLYDLVLQLNSEPGLDQWWATVTNIMHDNFKADRVTLVVPQDPTDMENVPWGQKATFSMNGPEEFVAHPTVLEQSANTARPSSESRPDWMFREGSVDDLKPQRLHRERLRPRLEARHSYAGHASEVKDISHSSGRPSGPQRTVTHAAGMTASVAPGISAPQRHLSSSTAQHGSFSDPDFSTVAGDIDAGPYAEVFPTMRGLDHEVRPLIEPGGVNRVLDRGRLVTVTRDYAPDTSESSDSHSSSAASDTAVNPEPTPHAAQGSALGKSLRSIFAPDVTPVSRDYEEYEQYPTSPWSQSPAPSPAIQSDEEANPFFASEQQVEDSFNPVTTPKDYSKFGQVGAIGVDRASTVIHIPLVHPTLSQPMQSLRISPPNRDQPGLPHRSNTLDMERKAPIAILSILSSAVPYPHSLTQSLKLLGPHLATSYAVSQQFSSTTHMQPVTIRHRRTTTGQTITNAPMTVEPTSLDDIMKAEIEGPPGSASSVTSPSETSGRSTHSPSGSIVETPGWDPASHGWTASRSIGGTPALTGTEIVDSYFDAKRRSVHRSASTSSGYSQATPAKSNPKMQNSAAKQRAPKPSIQTTEESRTRLSDGKSRAVTNIRDDRSPRLAQSGRDHSPQRSSASHPLSLLTEQDQDRKHSQLHSYGADFQASFGGLPSISKEPRTPGISRHVRNSSYPDEMPPPSERLLRTIIDSVPVQIFTAEPKTGKMTWVNSKYLIYRGQEAHQVLQEPWHAIHQHDREEFMSTWHRCLRTEQQLQQKVRLQRFDNNYRWFYVRAAPLKDKRQNIVHWIGTMMDFHEQHLAETNSARQQETAASEAKYRALANSSPQIVFAVSKAKGVTFCNSQWVQFSGQTEAQALGVGFMDHVHPDDLVKCKLPTFEGGSRQPTNVPTSVPPDLQRKESGSVASSSGSSETEKGLASMESSPMTSHMPQRKLSELASTGIMKVGRDADGRPSYSTEVRLKNKAGNFRWHLVRVLVAEPSLQNDSDEETWYGTCTDINDHKTLERDLKETMDEKSRFLSNMSHEIRTPLNGITGMVNFLIDSSLSAEQMEHVNIIRASTEGLRGLINDILDLSKAEAGMIQLNMDWLYVRALIEEINDLTSTMAIDKGLELNYLVAEDVPTQIKGDRFRLRQVLLNIVGNAIKFTQKGEVFVRCSTWQSSDCELAQNETFIKFDVTDTGRGFTDTDAEHLFKRFSQIDSSSTRQHGGSGLGLVISQQLVQLHGGDMSAKGVPGQGSTFTFTVKATLPTKFDRPPPQQPNDGSVVIPILPVSPGPSPMTAPKPPPKFAHEHTQSPSPYATSPDVGRESPAVSTGSSNPSIISAARTNSVQSGRSSISSYNPDNSVPAPLMDLAIPQHRKLQRSDTADSLLSTTSESSMPPSPGSALLPPMYSILVLCPLKYSREATVNHIETTLPKKVPHHITASETLAECQSMIGGGDPVIFSHVVMVLQQVKDITALVEQILSSPTHHLTQIVIITDLAQRKKIVEEAAKHDYEQLATERRIRFVFKPLKPSRFAVIFDPRKEREWSTDRNQYSAQQVVTTQKQVFEDLTKRLGNRDKRVLLVEDNKTNQLVVLKFLAKVSITADIAVDGVECTNKVFEKPYGYYSIILCDLHMPNKDGYQTCKEIRKWERQNRYPHQPIIALSANVLGDVYSKCTESGFNSYLTKPVDFKELSQVLTTFMDPSDPSKPHEFMKRDKRRRSVAPVH